MPTAAKSRQGCVLRLMALGPRRCDAAGMAGAAESACWASPGDLQGERGHWLPTPAPPAALLSHPFSQTQVQETREARGTRYGGVSSLAQEAQASNSVASSRMLVSRGAHLYHPGSP